jgi:hypothetical protein
LDDAKLTELHELLELAAGGRRARVAALLRALGIEVTGGGD